MEVLTHNNKDINSTTKSTTLDALTSFRFFAAALIVLKHSYEFFKVPSIYNIFQLTQGVSFFFVLSGFILAYNYDTELRRPWRDFYIARFARIWPAHITALGLLFLIVINPFGGATTTDMRVATLISNLLLVQSWVPEQGFFFSYNAVAWSLSTEVGFYLLFPLLLLRSAETLPWKALCMSAALAVLFVALGAYFELTYVSKTFEPSLRGLIMVNPLARLFEFSLGIFACALYRRINHAMTAPWGALEVFALLFVGVSMWVSVDGHLIHITTTAIMYYVRSSGSALAFFALILIFACSRGPIATLLARRPFIFLGEISFCLYLVHQPIIHWIAQSHALSPDSLIDLCTYWVVCLVFAYGLFALVEKPIRHRIIVKMRCDPKNPLKLSVLLPVEGEIPAEAHRLAQDEGILKETRQ